MKKRAQSGFTLIEFMVVIAIAAVLLTVGIPSMKYLIERNAVNGHVSMLIGDVTLARSEAIKRNAPVIMCVSVGADTSSTPDCAASGDWKSGWLVFVHRGSGSSFAPNSGDVLLRAQGALSDSGGITQTGTGVLVFRNTGLLSSGASTITFKSASQATNQQQRVCISMTGRTRRLDRGTDTCS